MNHGGWVLGLGGSDHDYSAVLASGTDVKVAIERERITRVKHGVAPWYEEPFGVCAEYCFETVGIERHDLLRVVSHDLLPSRTLVEWNPTTPTTGAMRPRWP